MKDGDGGPIRTSANGPLSWRRTGRVTVGGSDGRRPTSGLGVGSPLFDRSPDRDPSRITTFVVVGPRDLVFVEGILGGGLLGQDLTRLPSEVLRGPPMERAVPDSLDTFSTAQVRRTGPEPSPTPSEREGRHTRPCRAGTSRGDLPSADPDPVPDDTPTPDPTPDPDPDPVRPGGSTTTDSSHSIPFQ